jgi:hypothetical protein
MARMLPEADRPRQRAIPRVRVFAATQALRNKKAAAVSRGGFVLAEGSSTNKTAAIAGGCYLKVIVQRRLIPSFAGLAVTYSRAS